MTPAARVQAAIEVLDAVIAAARGQGASADRVIADWFRTRRFAGSGDRRAVRDLAYAAIRACGPVPASGRAAMVHLAAHDPALAALFDGSRHGPAPLVADEPEAEGGIAPAWLEARLAASGIADDSARALLGRAPLDLRVNALKADRASIDLPLEGEPLAAPQGLRFPHGTPVEQWVAFKDGRIEVQDGGSQLACLAVGAHPGETVIDLCAGAGGKTLALAAAMAGKGRLIACDTDRARLSRLAPRAERAGATFIETRLLDPGREAEALADLAGTADAVLIDAPCSGTGTWRRNPEARWRLTEAELARVTAIQARLLDVAAGLVRPGGRLVFVTCSLLDAEGADQAAAFLARHPDWTAQEFALGAGSVRGAGIRLDPAQDSTDGFFIAGLVSP
ncbi:16S rRNA (cytosine967-C5)-methyltransferase [Novosphingobium kunmingense]|uniref:16S rRNA (Cytosine967-C5)-methyltransferase n=1 Tax=Novosphingobium kunmingense TaxID=1211806 RepID=A0A2N0I3H7_9SPHN|nr:RsmB/NOP family class I SAM-dependent RNA methyltransferase [Novosphingobium kunmingense]PKB25739.1 16S rRNA (cytosine967-C5)-methyltransferase [Novosphingobium kunmingense]